MYFAQTYRTRWHDTDADGVLRPSSLLMYMQETANLQCREWGCDLDKLHHEEGLGFLMSRLMLRADASLHAYEDIEVRTWCGESKGMTFLRCFSIRRDGKTVAEAVSHWALMDLRARRLVRVRDFDRPFPIDAMPAEDTLPRKVRILPGTELEPVGDRLIVYSDLDFNGHMNNTHYPDMVCDFLPGMAGRRISTLSLSYLHEAAFGDRLTVHRTRLAGEGETYLLRTVRPDGTVCLEAEVGLSPI